MEQIKQNAYQLKYILQHSIDAENPEMLKNRESFNPFDICNVQINYSNS